MISGTSFQVVTLSACLHHALSIAGLDEGPRPVLLDPTAQSPGVFGILHSSDRRPPERRTDDRIVRPEKRLFYWANTEGIIRGDSNRIDSETSPPDESAALKRAFAGFEQKLEAHPQEEIQDAEAVEALRALGYIR